MNRSSLQWLGLAADVRPVNVMAYLLSSFLSVACLVFLNASTSFVLTAVVRLPLDHLGRVSGSLVLLDELVALPAVLVWGRCADLYGFRFVSVVGHVLVAIALSIFVQARSTLELCFARVLVSIGFAALTTMLSATLGSLSTSIAVNTVPSSSDEQTETTPLLLSSSPVVSECKHLEDQRSAKLSGIIGFSSGLGALFAVFCLLRLPPLIVNRFPTLSPRDALKEAIKTSFYITSVLALLVGLSLIVGLRRRNEGYSLISKNRSTSTRTGWWSSLRPLAYGFDLCLEDPYLVVAYAAGFSARATTIAVSAFIPVLVNQYYIASGQCQLDRPNVPSDEVKKGCHAAFALASALTGTVQLSALLLAPLVGWLASHRSQPALLAFSNAVGAIGFLTMGLLPNPRHWLMWPICVALGVAQISGIVVSLSLCASGRSRIQNAIFTRKKASLPPVAPSDEPCTANQSTQDVIQNQSDISGAIAGVYSLCGGLGILVGSIGGILADWQPQAPFFLTGALTATVSLLCFSFLWCRASQNSISCLVSVT
ncbi:uncharacterized protein MELLADRAFT_95427 [Melampsora larici-populina 98AG31]|uniref:Major facilitator superfamily (MFS) profile domain-containing protein n=1 Tax=Melampsora larici-populina (strain 98AG31 / pathotype 3-4-7) TaxID=747676 RepID=F4S9A0_MELLP|nr:uncharacterized protein MELLADRAFT_95427 [Melampsora larici-populina 98AG31]EGF98783.1 hypothetical protein MELLADRAFT_95427 [Melampsora larici-populina 98AG31]